MSEMFEEFNCKVEDKIKTIVVEDILKEAYNQGVSDSQIALLSVNSSNESQDEFILKAEKAIVGLYVEQLNHWER